jgi:hypothetical protein
LRNRKKFQKFKKIQKNSKKFKKLQTLKMKNKGGKKGMCISMRSGSSPLPGPSSLAKDNKLVRIGLNKKINERNWGLEGEKKEIFQKKKKKKKKKKERWIGRHPFGGVICGLRNIVIHYCM